MSIFYYFLSSHLYFCRSRKDLKFFEITSSSEVCLMCIVLFKSELYIFSIHLSSSRSQWWKREMGDYVFKWGFFNLGGQQNKHTQQSSFRYQTLSQRININFSFQTSVHSVFAIVSRN